LTGSYCLQACAFLISAALICSAQTYGIADSTLDATGLPGYLKLLPQPTPEPWRKITEKERFNYYVLFTFTPLAGISAAFGGAISQGIDSPPEWGQGWGPYGVRVGSSYGSTVVGNTVTYGTSMLFRDDNRYVRSNKHGINGRLGNVLLSPYVAHSNTGKRRFSTSSFLGGVSQATVPLAWSPRSWQGWQNIGVNYLIWYGQTAGINLASEFYASFVGYFKNKSHNKAAAANTASNKLSRPLATR
jgi:hypothetical protein